MNHFEQQSYYELLEVPVSASQAQILGAYTQAMETYAPDSIAVYTLVDPGQLEALHERLAKARDVLCTLERRLEYDRQLGVTRTPEELALLRGEDLASAAAPQTPAPESSEIEALELLETEVVVEDPPAAQAAPVVTAAPVAETAPVAEAPAAESAPVVQAAAPVVEVAPVVEPAPVVDAASVVVDLTAMLEAAPVGEEPSVIVEPSAVAVTPPPPPPPEALLPEPQAGTKPVVHARPSAPARRHGGVIPPPLPARPGLRSPPARPTAESPRAVSRPPPAQPPGDASALPPAASPPAAESSPNPASMKGRDSRTRLKTVVDISAEAEFNGELLRQVREGRNLSPHSLADRTRISVRHVENIEADRYDQLPAPVYLRGMLMSMARELGLDPLRVSRSYMALASSEDRKKR
ncbi:helix-turn-helix domain-containing protein [Cystobacter fuscus]|uniref:helix-turn-helix domain-containing protein n=1 Tax=Cystobacter fuscus TaxID=43 RepID=UPI002B2F93F9|nr:DnaJ domain-containing protein [Cystobacter fuscus]